MTTVAAPATRSANSTPRPHRWTCAEFHRIGDRGMFEGRQAMLIDGVIYEEGPMSPPHAITLGLIEAAIRNSFGPGWWLRNQSPLVLSQNLDPEPDLAVVKGSPRDFVNHPRTAELVVEVADTSLDFDLNEKRLIYAHAGIPEYWVVDINSRQLHVHRNPKAGDYLDVKVHQPSDAATPISANVLIRVSEILP